MKDHGDIALAWFEAGDVFIVDENAAAGGRLKTCQGAQGGGLSAAGWADEHQKLTICDFQVKVLDRGLGGVGVGDVDLLKSDLCHAPTLAPPLNRLCWSAL